MSVIYKKQKQLRNFAIFLVFGFTLLLRLLFFYFLDFAFWHWYVCYFISVNLVTWLVFLYDKRISARQGVVRVPENTLFLLSVAGGLPSALMAMQVLRHKRAKSSFKLKLFVWFMVVYSLLGAGYWFLGDELRKLIF